MMDHCITGGTSHWDPISERVYCSGILHDTDGQILYRTCMKCLVRDTRKTNTVQVLYYKC